MTIGLPARVGDGTYIDSMLEDRQGALWFGTGDGLYRRLPDGRAQRYTIRNGLPSNFVESLLEDNRGRLWVGTRYGGLCQIVENPDPDRSIVAALLTTRDGLPSNWIESLFQFSDNRLMVGTINGISEIISSENGGFKIQATPSSISNIQRSHQ